MNTKITALTLAAATAFAFTPKPAVAGDKGLAVVGGIIGGLIIASAINDHHDTSAVYVSRGYNGHGRYDNSGYWKNVSVNVWVPGYWIVERSHHNRSHRRYVEGYYECRTDRVWVSYDRHDRYDRNDDRRDHRDNRHDRDTSRGYGNDRRDRRHR